MLNGKYDYDNRQSENLQPCTKNVTLDFCYENEREEKGMSNQQRQNKKAYQMVMIMKETTDEKRIREPVTATTIGSVLFNIDL